MMKECQPKKNCHSDTDDRLPQWHTIFSKVEIVLELTDTILAKVGWKDVETTKDFGVSFVSGFMTKYSVLVMEQKELWVGGTLSLMLKLTLLRCVKNYGY